MVTEDKILGCLIGGTIGDSVGAAYEGKSAPQATKLKPTYITDDTQLTLATCEAIINKDKVDPEAIANSMLRWFQSHKLSGLGASTLKALIELTMGQHWALCGRKGEYAAGNGAAMRIAPLAFFLDPTNRWERLIIRDVSRITHHSEEAYCGALSVIAMLRHMLAHNNLEEKENPLLEVVNILPDSSVRDRLLIIAELWPNASIEYIASNFGASAYVVESVPLAVYASSLIGHLSFENILLNLINVGGDTDTNCSIAGQLMGSYLGFVQLPIILKDDLPVKKEIIQISAKLMDLHTKVST